MTAHFLMKSFTANSKRMLKMLSVSLIHFHCALSLSLLPPSPHPPKIFLCIFSGSQEIIDTLWFFGLPKTFAIHGMLISYSKKKKYKIGLPVLFFLQIRLANAVQHMSEGVQNFLQFLNLGVVFPLLPKTNINTQIKYNV